MDSQEITETRGVRLTTLRSTLFYILREIQGNLEMPDSEQPRAADAYGASQTNNESLEWYKSQISSGNITSEVYHVYLDVDAKRTMAMDENEDIRRSTHEVQSLEQRITTNKSEIKKRIERIEQITDRLRQLNEDEAKYSQTLFSMGEVDLQTQGETLERLRDDLREFRRRIVEDSAEKTAAYREIVVLSEELEEIEQQLNALKTEQTERYIGNLLTIEKLRKQLVLLTAALEIERQMMVLETEQKLITIVRNGDALGFKSQYLEVIVGPNTETVNPNIRDEEGRTLLMIAIAGCNSDVDDRLKIIETLLHDPRTDLTATDSEGKTWEDYLDTRSEDVKSAIRKLCGLEIAIPKLDEDFARLNFGEDPKIIFKKKDGRIVSMTLVDTSKRLPELEIPEWALARISELTDELAARGMFENLVEQAIRKLAAEGCVNGEIEARTAVAMKNLEREGFLDAGTKLIRFGLGMQRELADPIRTFGRTTAANTGKPVRITS